METQEQPTTGDSGASTLDRLDRFLSADEAPEQQANPEPDQSAQREPEQADVQAKTETDPADVPEQDSETPNEYHLADIAKLLGADESALDVDDEGNVAVKTKIDGQEGKVKFADLVKSYQLQGHVDKQVRDVAEVRKQTQEERQAFQQEMQIQQKLVKQAAKIEAGREKLAEYAAINWRDLYDSDPATAAKLDHSYRELQQQDANLINEFNHVTATTRQQQSEASYNANLERLQREGAALAKALPDWQDSKRAQAEAKEIQKMLLERGYSEDEVVLKRDSNGRITNWGVMDHKAVLLARDAWLYRQQQTANKAAEKQVRAAPKIIKPGTSGQGASQAKTIQNLKTEVHRSGGSRQSVIDYLLASGKA
jgi:hypothetical protein